MNDNTWTQEWPIKPGLYWFYGWTWMGKSDTLNSRAPKYHCVRVQSLGGGSRGYVCDGAFMYKSERHVGLWTPANPPAEPPTKDEIAEVFGM